MGFFVEDDIYRLNFKNTKYDGLIVTCTSMSVDGFISVAALQSKAKASAASGEDQVSEAMSLLLDRFADALVEWNLVDRHGNEIPATRAGVGAQSLKFIMELIGAWMDAVGNVSDPLEKPSANGESALGLSEMTERL